MTKATMSDPLQRQHSEQLLVDVAIALMWLIVCAVLMYLLVKA